MHKLTKKNNMVVDNSFDTPRTEEIIYKNLSRPIANEIIIMKIQKFSYQETAISLWL